jgi:ribosomal protein L37AE/L43A
MNEADKTAEDWGKEERRFCPSCNSTSMIGIPDPEGYGYVWECDNCGAIDATDDTPDEEKDEDDE